MAKPRIKINHAGFKQLLKSDDVMRDLIHRGNAIQAAAGPEYEVSPFTGKNRARVSVGAWTPEAARDNAKSNTLIRSIDAGR